MVKGTMVQFVQLHPSSYAKIKWDKVRVILIDVTL